MLIRLKNREEQENGASWPSYFIEDRTVGLFNLQIKGLEFSIILEGFDKKRRLNLKSEKQRTNFKTERKSRCCVSEKERLLVKQRLSQLIFERLEWSACAGCAKSKVLSLSVVQSRPNAGIRNNQHLNRHVWCI